MSQQQSTTKIIDDFVISNSSDKYNEFNIIKKIDLSQYQNTFVNETQILTKHNH